MVKVLKKQKMRFGRGNLVKGRNAFGAGDLRGAIVYFGKLARNRQRAAKEQ